MYAWVVVFVLPINSALNPIIYTLAAPTELRRRIFKWCQQTIRNLLFKCSLITDGKNEQNSSSMVSHTSLTVATENRSSNGSAVSLPMTLHSLHSTARSFHTIRTIRLWTYKWSTSHSNKSISTERNISFDKVFIFIINRFTYECFISL